MSKILEAVREKYPEYKDVPDAKLTKAIGDKYPTYLSQDEQFGSDYFKLTNPPPPTPAHSPSEYSSGFSSTTPTGMNAEDWALTQGLAQEAKAGFPTLQKPFIPIPTAEVKPDDSKAVAVGKEAYNLIKGIPEFIESPLGIITLPLAAEAKTAKIVSGLFGASSFESAGQKVLAANENWDKYTPAEKSAAITGIVGTSAFGAFLTRAAFKGGTPVMTKEQAAANAEAVLASLPRFRAGVPDITKQVAPATADALQQTLTKKSEVENASNKPSAESVSKPEVRPSVGEEAPLRQQGQAPTAQPPLQQGAEATPVTPAIQTTKGEVITGENHVAAYEKAKETVQPDTSGSKEGFVDNATGQFISREEAAAKTGLPTNVEKGKLHSSDLAKIEPSQKTPKGEDMRPNQPYPEQTAEQKLKDWKSNRRIIEENYRFAAPNVLAEKLADFEAKFPNPLESAKSEPTPTPPEPKPVVEKVKEPWEMTKAEIIDRIEKPKEMASEWSKEKAIAESKELLKSGDLNLDEKGTGVEGVTKKGIAWVKKTTADMMMANQTRGMTAGWKLNYAKDVENAIGTHKTAIIEAMREGETVPPEVLADYPDLQKPSPPPKTTPTPSTAQLEAEPTQIAPAVGAGSRPFEVDEQVVMHSPHTGEDVLVSYRGPLGSDKSVVWTGRTQMAIPNEWLRHQGEIHEGQIQPMASVSSVAKVEKPLSATTEVRGKLQPEIRLSQTDPRTLTDEQLQSELKSLDASAAPLHEEFQKIPEDLLLTRRGTSTPAAKAIEDKLKPIYNRKSQVQFEIQRRANEIKNKAMFAARDKRIADAPVFQRRNGWEIVKDGVNYVLRDPYTKEDIYSGKLSRCREVADESKPVPPAGIEESKSPQSASAVGRGAEQSAPASSHPTPPPSEAKGGEAEIRGMGGMAPSDPFEQSNFSGAVGIKNAAMEKLSQELGVNDYWESLKEGKRSHPQVWNEAMARLNNEWDWPDKIIENVKEKPRQLSDAEEVALMYRLVDLKLEHAKLSRDLMQAIEDGREFPNRLEEVEPLKIRMAATLDRIQELMAVTKSAGREWGRSGRMRQRMMQADYSLASMEVQRREANNGQPLTDKQRAEIEALHNQLATLKKSMDDLNVRLSKEEAKRALAEAKAESQPKYSKGVLDYAEKFAGYMDKKAESALERIRNRRMQGQAFSGAPIDPTLLDDYAIVGAAKITRGLTELGEWSASMVKDLGDWIKPHLDQIWKAANAKQETELSSLEKKIGTEAGKKVRFAVKDRPIADQKKRAISAITNAFNAGKKDSVTGQIQKLARVLVAEGVKDTDKLIDAIHTILKDIDPAITRRETMDAISGYGDFKQLSKDKISVLLRGMKGEMQQIAKLEDMAAGQPPLKTGVERRVPTDAERQLIKKVNEAKFAFQVPITDPTTQLKSALDTYKTNVKTRIADYEERIRTGNFEKKPHRELNLDSEAIKLRHKEDVVKREFHALLLKDKFKNQNIWQRTGRFVGEVVNTMRAIKASMDLSATLRQGGIIFASHPIRGAKIMPDQLKALISPLEQFRVEQEILNRPNYPLYERSGLNLTEHGQKLSQMEEAYMSRWAEHIPGVAASQRAYTVFLNKLRADSFDAMAKWVAKEGELGVDDGKVIANYINVATGRGNIGMRENALVGLNTAFFAPRLVASRFQFIFGQPLYHGLFSGKTKLAGSWRSRALVATEYGRFLAAAGTLYTLASLAGFTIGVDPRSSDFGKIIIGQTRIDPMAGLIQGTVLLSRLVSGEQKNARGKVVPIRGQNVPYGSSNAADIIARFLRTKLSPAFGTAVDVTTGQNVVGQPVTPQSAAIGAVIPLSLNDVYNSMKAQGIPEGSIIALLSILGIGVSTYNTKTSTATQEDIDRILQESR